MPNVCAFCGGTERSRRVASSSGYICQECLLAARAVLAGEPVEDGQRGGRLRRVELGVTCAFCSRGAREAHAFVLGGTRCAICDDCVALFSAPPVDPGAEGLSSDDVRRELEAANDCLREATSVYGDLARQIRGARGDATFLDRCLVACDFSYAAARDSFEVARSLFELAEGAKGPVEDDVRRSLLSSVSMASKATARAVRGCAMVGLLVRRHLEDGEPKPWPG